MDNDEYIGKKFGRLTVIKFDHKKKYESYYLCRCDCGNSHIVAKNSLKQGNTKSCGCLKKEIITKYNQTAKRKYNNYNLNEEYGIGYTTNTNEEFYFDLEDYDKIKDYCWYIKDKSHTKHIGTTIREDGNKKNMMIYNLILLNNNKIKGFEVDHIDRNPLNNRKDNLRLVLHKDNIKNYSKPKNNTSGIIGVSYDKRNQKWKAKITCDNNIINLGTYVNKDDAIKSRLKAEKEYFGEFASQKHLFEQYGIEQDDKYFDIACKRIFNTKAVYKNKVD